VIDAISGWMPFNGRRFWPRSILRHVLKEPGFFDAADDR
jgi:hypothetical protein